MDVGKFGRTAGGQYLRNKTVGGQFKTRICLWPILKKIALGVRFDQTILGGQYRWTNNILLFCGHKFDFPIAGDMFVNFSFKIQVSVGEFDSRDRREKPLNYISIL